MKTTSRLLTLFLLITPLHAAEEAKTAQQLLRDGLFEEEANADLDKAEAAYEKLILRYDEERRYAGTALFRLAEISGKRGDKEKAAARFGRVVQEFGEQAALASRAQKRLRELGAPAAPADLPAAAKLASSEEAGELKRLQGLLASSPDLLDGVDADGKYPLHQAAEKGWLQAIDFLLERKVTIDSRTTKGQHTPLHLAVALGHLSAVQKLAAAGAKLDSTFPAQANELPVPPPPYLRNNIRGQWTPLHLAVLYGRREVASALLKAGARAGAAKIPLETIPRLTAGGSSSLPSAYATPLILALWLQDSRMAKSLIEAGADPNQVVSRDGNSPLVTLVRRMPEELPAFLKLGMKVTEERYLGRTALLHALETPKSPAIRELVLNGADLTALVEPEWRADHMGGDVLELAVQMAAWANDPEADGTRPLYADDVKFLLAKGAKPTSRALWKAVSIDQPELVRILLDAGGDPNAVMEGDAKTPLLHGAPSAEVAELLIERGARLDAKDAQGNTVLQNLFLRNSGQAREEKLLELLLAKGADPSAVELGVGSLRSTTTLPSLAPYFFERLRYKESITQKKVMLALPFQGTILTGDVRLIEGTPAPTLAELFVSVFWHEAGRPRLSKVHELRVFRLEAGELKEAQRIGVEELSAQSPLDIRWGDLVEVQMKGDKFEARSGPGLGRSNVRVPGARTSGGELGVDYTDWVKQVKARTITLRTGPWESKIALGAASAEGMFLREHFGESSRVTDLSKVRVKRGTAEPLVMDLRLGVENEYLRLIDGDVIEVPLVEAMTKGTPDGKTRWDGIVMFSPDRPGSEKPGDREAARFTSIIALLGSDTTLPKYRDLSRMEIWRQKGGAVEKIPVDIERLFGAIPRFEWTVERLLALNVPLQNGDLVVFPVDPEVSWTGRYTESRPARGVIKEAMEFLSPKRAQPTPPQNATPRASGQPARRRQAILPPRSR